MPFGIIGRTGPGMRQVVGFGDRSTERVPLGAKPMHCCIRWGPRRARGREGFGFFPFSQWQMPLGRRR